MQSETPLGVRAGNSCQHFSPLKLANDEENFYLLTSRAIFNQLSTLQANTINSLEHEQSKIDKKNQEVMAEIESGVHRLVRELIDLLLTLN